MTKKANNYESTQRARVLKRQRCKLNNHEVRISAKANPMNHLVILSQVEVGELLGITRSRVQQLERIALWKIRQELRKTYL